MNPFMYHNCVSDELKSTGVYIHVMELPVNSLIPSRFLLRVYSRKATRDQMNKNQRTKYIENDEYPNWRENAAVVEQCASVPSVGNSWLVAINNMHNGDL